MLITHNGTEAEAVVHFPVDGPDAATRAAEVIKLGAQGAFYATPGSSGLHPSFSGHGGGHLAAGDAFNGALAVCLAEGMALPEAVRVSCAAGALAVTTTGAQNSMPTRRRSKRCLRERKAATLQFHDNLRN